MRLLLGFLLLFFKILASYIRGGWAFTLIAPNYGTNCPCMLVPTLPVLNSQKKNQNNSSGLYVYSSTCFYIQLNKLRLLKSKTWKLWCLAFLSWKVTKRFLNVLFLFSIHLQNNYFMWSLIVCMDFCVFLPKDFNLLILLVCLAPFFKIQKQLRGVPIWKGKTTQPEPHYTHTLTTKSLYTVTLDTHLSVPVIHQLDWPLHEGDNFHPLENIEKMTRGEPLTDQVSPGVCVMFY